MKICRLIRYDVRQGFGQAKFKLIGIAVIVLVSCLDFYMRKTHVSSMRGIAPSGGTCLDYLFFLLGGSREYRPEVDLKFIFPVKWLLLHLYLLYGTLYYPYRDLLSSMGGSLVVKSKSRRAWWASKCLWNVLYMAVAYAVIFAVTALFCLVAGETFSLQITPQLLHDFMDTGSIFETFPLALSVYTILLPMVISMGMSLLQMTMSLFIKPVFSFGISAMLMLASSYAVSSWLMGNYAMPVRSIYVVEQGFSLGYGIFAGVLLMVFSVVMGGICFHRYDILNASEL